MTFDLVKLWVKKCPIRLALLAAFGGVVLPAHAAEPESESAPSPSRIDQSTAAIALTIEADEPRWFDQLGERAWLQNYDPTLLSRRILTQISYEELNGGVSTTEWKSSYRGAIPLRDDLAFGFQFAQPVKWKDDGADWRSGLGDFEVRAGVIGRLSPTLRWAVALNSKFDTATADTLGDDVFQIRPIAAVRWDASERVNLGLNLEYTFTPWDEGSDDLSYLELKIPVALKLSQAWSASATYVPRWNFETDRDRHRLETAVTLNWGPSREYAWWIGAELPLSSQDFDGKIITGFIWSFK